MILCSEEGMDCRYSTLSSHSLILCGVCTCRYKWKPRHGKEKENAAF